MTINENDVIKTVASSLLKSKPAFLSEQMVNVWVDDHYEDINHRIGYVKKQCIMINLVGLAFSSVVSLILSSKSPGIDWTNFLTSIPFFQSAFVIIFLILYFPNMKKIKELLREEKDGWIFVAEKCKCTVPNIRMINEEDIDTYKKLVGKDLGRGCPRCNSHYKLVRVWKKLGKRYQKKEPSK